MRLVGMGPPSGPLVELLFGPPQAPSSAATATMPDAGRQRMFDCMGQFPFE